MTIAFHMTAQDPLLLTNRPEGSMYYMDGHSLKCIARQSFPKVIRADHHELKKPNPVTSLDPLRR